MFEGNPRSPSTTTTAQTKTAAIASRKSEPTHYLPGPALDVNDLIEQVSMLMLRDPRPVYQRKA